jgi:hypothetical protein
MTARIAARSMRRRAARDARCGQRWRAWQTPDMDGSGITWIVMVRDVSHAVRIQDQPRVVASLVLDAETGLLRGASVAPTGRAACAEAMRTALTKPAGPLPPQTPVRVLCGGGQAAEVLDELDRLLAGAVTPTVAESEPIGEAEDIFDSFVGHMAGRRQPEEFPTPADWQTLFTRASDYCRVRPWLRWSDADQLDLVVKIDGVAVRYVAVVIGQEGIQRGLVLYPGALLADGLSGWEPGRSVPLPAGTVLLWLDPPDEVPPEFAAKAVRYGWPQDADLIPVCLTGGPDGPADLDRRSAHHLTLAIAAVLAHDRHRPIPGNGVTKTTGELTLADNQQGTYSIG